MTRTLSSLLLATVTLLAGCDYLGIESAVKVAEQKEAEGKAVGGACRHALKSVEDCYRQNPKAGKAAVFTGWKDMDVYMRENNIAGVPPTAVPEAKPADSASKEEEVVADKKAAAKDKH